jgi:hypothetical protein
MNKPALNKWLEELGFDSSSPVHGVEHIDSTRRYRFSAYLLNQDDRAVGIRRGAIDELVIEDDILDWYHKGIMTFSNPDDIIERSTTIHEGKNISDGGNVIEPYRFRGDCRDFLYILLEPHLDDIAGGIRGDLESPTYTIQQLFSIFAVERIPGETKRDKKTKIHFHDYKYQLMCERNLYYSTAKNMKSIGKSSGSHTSIKQINNTDREKYTGEIIQDIITKALPDADTDGLFSYHWNFGGTKLLYTSPSQYKAINDLNYVLSHHASGPEDSHDPCILRNERTTERWELLPVSEYFKRSTYNDGPGAYHTEHFLISFDGKAGIGIPPSPKTFGMKGQTPITNYHFPDLSVIDDFSFSEIQGDDCQKYLNSIIMHKYSKKNKLFNIDLSEHSIDNVRTHFQDNYIDNTFGGDSGHGATSWLSDTARDVNLNIRVGSKSGETTSTIVSGRNKTLLNAFLLGNAIQFNVQGESSRRAGVWISLDRRNEYIDNEYDEKVLGQYFVTKVTHRIDINGYSNSIVGVKPYLYKQLNFNTSNIFDSNINK